MTVASAFYSRYVLDDLQLYRGYVTQCGCSGL